METVTFPGRYESLASISDFVGRAASNAGLDHKSVYAVQLAVDEACCNIIDHAYGGEGKGDVKCTVDVREGEITVILQDRGQPFNPDKVASPKLNTPLDKVKSRGAGLYLIRKMMDQVHYESTPGSGNILTMQKRRS
jgi:serine/threonine-protein kinase RsbW